MIKRFTSSRFDCEFLNLYIHEVCIRVEREIEVDQPTNTNKDPLYVPNGPMTRSKTKALNALVLKVLTKSDLNGPLKYQEEDLVHLIHVQERPNPTLFGL